MTPEERLKLEDYEQIKRDYHELIDLHAEKKKEAQQLRSQLNLKGTMSVLDSDIATVEALHALLIDNHGYKLDHITLKKSRELTEKMYQAMGWQARQNRVVGRDESNGTGKIKGDDDYTPFTLGYTHDTSD